VSDDFSGPFREHNQDVECAVAEWYRLVSLLEQPLGSKQAERTERKHVSAL
jgi:hypothetical protein